MSLAEICSPTGEFLVGFELRSLTGKTRVAQQVQWLTAHGIPHRRDGARVIVSRFHVRLWLKGEQSPALVEPNWAALNAPLSPSRAARKAPK